MVLTDADSMPAVVSLGTVGDAVVAVEPGPGLFAPQADAAHAGLQVGRAALAVRAALCTKHTHTEEERITFPRNKLFNA